MLEEIAIFDDSDVQDQKGECEQKQLSPPLKDNTIRSLNRPYACDFCSASYTTQSSLMRHQKDKHFKGYSNIEHEDSKSYSIERKGESTSNTIEIPINQTIDNVGIMAEIKDANILTNKSEESALESLVRQEMEAFNSVIRLTRSILNSSDEEDDGQDLSELANRYLPVETSKEKRHVLTSLPSEVNCSQKISERPKEELSFSCKICLMTFDRKFQLKHHKWRMHKKRNNNAIQENKTSFQSFVCDNCGKVFSSESCLRKHSIKIHKVRYPCGNCRLSFRKHIDLLKHKRLHDPKRKYPCDVCQLRYIDQNNLDKHKKRTHLKITTTPHDEESFITESQTKNSVPLGFKSDVLDCESPTVKTSNEEEMIKNNFINFDKVQYNCDVCAKTFSSESCLQKHTQNVHKVKYACDNCRLSFRKHKDLLKHKRLHDPMREYPCDICHLRFGGQKNLDDHSKRTHSKITMSPSVEEKLDVVLKLKDVQAPINIEPGAFWAEKLSLGTSSKDEIIKTNLNNVDEIKYNCDICKQTFGKKKMLWKHKRLHDLTRKFACDNCSLRYGSQSHLIYHKKRCIKTSKTFTTLDNSFRDNTSTRDTNSLKMKIFKVDQSYTVDDISGISKIGSVNQEVKISIDDDSFHPLPYLDKVKAESQSFSCDDCDKSFNLQEQLKFHKINAHITISDSAIEREYGRKYSCDECQKSFDNFDSLTNHRRFHDPMRKYPCSICSLRFERKDHLKRHKKNIHENEHCREWKRKYSCDECKKSFKNFESLTKHRRLHDPERKFPCNICSLRFDKKNGLERHRKKIHTSHTEFNGKSTVIVENIMTPTVQTLDQNQCLDDNIDLKNKQSFHSQSQEYSFSCNICEMRFSGMEPLANHQRIHDPKREFPCDTCSFRFTKKEHKERHEKLVHPISKDNIKSSIFTGLLDTNIKFRCDICLQDYNSQKSLRKHKIRTHFRGRKSYCCTQCVKSFYDFESLTKHNKLHDPNRKYPCDLCSLRYKDNYQLARHKKNFHSFTSPFGYNIYAQSNRSEYLRVKQETLDEDDRVEDSIGIGEAYDYEDSMIYVAEDNIQDDILLDNDICEDVHCKDPLDTSTY